MPIGTCLNVAVMYKICFIFCLVAQIFLGFNCVAQTTATIQPSSKDSQLRAAAPTTNYGTDVRMDADPWSADTKRPLVHFDLSSIPGGATINWATLTLYMKSTFGSTRTVNVHRLTKDWAQGTVTWNSPWTTAGGDYDGTATDGTELVWPTVTVDGPVTWDVTDDVVDYIGGTYNNYGWLLKDASEGAGASYYWAFHTLEATTSSFRPKLEVNYTVSGLPVEMVFFEADLVKDKVEINWITATEINNDNFQIERSIDTKNWEIIGSVKGHGTSYLTNNYNFVDNYPVKGLNYYRLKQTDFDGAFEYSDKVVVENVSDFSYQIYPIPADETLFVVWDNCDDNTTIELWDQVTSKVLVNINTQPKFASIDSKSLKAGMYYMKIGCGQNIDIVKVPVVH